MPITIQPYRNASETVLDQSRRDFLRKMFVAGMGAFCAPRAFAGINAEEVVVDPHSWALFADTHVAEDLSLRALGVNMAETFQQAVGEVVGMATRPGGVLINGDCAFRTGRPGDYVALTRLLEPLRNHGVPVHLTLGNHDDRSHFRAALPSGECSSALGDRHARVIETERANWILADSSTTPIGEGRLGPEQLAWMQEVLDAAPDKPAIIYAHHNPQDGYTEWSLEDTEDFFAMVAPRPQVKAYVFGHSHRWSIDQHESGMYLINLPSTAYVFEQEEPSGWVNATLLENGIHLELRCTDRTHPKHGERIELQWR